MHYSDYPGTRPRDCGLGARRRGLRVLLSPEKKKRKSSTTWFAQRLGIRGLADQTWDAGHKPRVVAPALPVSLRMKQNA